VCAAPAEGTETAYRDVYERGIAAFLLRLGSRPPGRWIYTSSTGVYDVRDGSVVDERTPPAASTARARALLAAEAAALAFGPAATVLRLGGIYGPGRAPMIDRILEGRPVEGAANFANTIHVLDAARAVAFLLDRGAPGDIVLGVDSEPAPRIDMARWLAKRLGVPEPETVAGERTQNKRCSNDKLISLGFQFLYPSYRFGYESILETGSHPVQNP
jgi:nucleoside-diphosphate-sugar epimerase